jgi:hypothetical protein
VTASVHIEIPSGLALLIRASRNLTLDVPPPVTRNSILDALEQTYPALRGTLRDQKTKIRRPFIRFFACGEDLSHDPPDEILPAAIAQGTQIFHIVTAIAGG